MFELRCVNGPLIAFCWNFLNLEWFPIVLWLFILFVYYLFIYLFLFNRTFIDNRIYFLTNSSCINMIKNINNVLKIFLLHLFDVKCLFSENIYLSQTEDNARPSFRLSNSAGNMMTCSRHNQIKFWDIAPCSQIYREFRTKCTVPTRFILSFAHFLSIWVGNSLNTKNWFN